MASKFLRHLLAFSLILLSSLLLVLSFPKFDLGFLAWVGILPLLIAINGKNLRYGFFYCLVCGMVFFVGVFYWILAFPKFTLLQQILLALYLGSYFGVFGLMFNLVSTRWGMTPALFSTPFIWVSLEWVRSNLSFLALPWALLGHSQYQYPTTIQIASVAGTYSISFLIVLVNAALASVIYPYLSKFSGQEIPPNLSLPEGGLTVPPVSKPERRGFQIDKGRIALLATTASLIIPALIYGHTIISQPIIGNKVKISLVQGNIEQVRKWDPKHARDIMQTYAALTEEASKDQPALIVWPETATPGAINLNPKLQLELREIVKKAGTYLLLGSAQHQKFREKGAKKFEYVNSAFLVGPEAKMFKPQQYDKIRLFPFGEYLPYKGTIPWSSLKVSGSDNYVPGNKITIFEHPGFRFGVIICWENAFPELVRQFVQKGAQFMVNITNEAWFGQTAAPYQLVGISVFRAVENRVFIVRCANTGVSCIIDPYGRILDRVKDENGQDIFIRGIMTGWITPLDSKTIYTRYGDLLVWVAFLGAAIFLAAALMKGLKKN